MATPRNHFIEAMNLLNIDVSLLPPGATQTTAYSPDALKLSHLASALARVDQACLRYELAAQCARFIREFPTVTKFLVYTEAEVLVGEGRVCKVSIQQPEFSDDTDADQVGDFLEGQDHLADALLGGESGDDAEVIQADTPAVKALMAKDTISGREAMAVLMPDLVEGTEADLRHAAEMLAELGITNLLAANGEVQTGASQ